ncbi:trypsin delta-like [Episyrphus balteatus]|uniref:trypsin delta-like n=1 Tax=Episyrphus balteatus TaxID=286459 RepID=UPI002485440F|nr:trypsin delta-like [Episyrphus balteatus]
MLRATVILILLCLTIGPSYGQKKKKVDNDEIEDKIVGGSTGLISDYPFIVSIQRRDVHQCGGSIIKPSLILTAAHCIAVFAKSAISGISVRAGATIWSQGGQQVKVKKMIPHPLYESTTNGYDIGFLVLEKPLEFDDTVQPITLATKIPAGNKEGRILGWGLKKEKADVIPSMLQVARVMSISRARCASEEFGYSDDIKDTMICAQNPGVDACQGDSGGPYVSWNSTTNKPDKLVAVTSFGKGCGRKDYPGVYTALAAVSKWIQKIIDQVDSFKEHVEA